MFDGNKYSNHEMSRHNGMNSIRSSTICSSVVTQCVVLPPRSDKRTSRFISDSGMLLQKQTKCLKLLMEMKPILVRLSSNGLKDRSGNRGP